MHIFKPFSESIFCERQRYIVELVFQNNLKSLAKEVDNWPLFNDRFASKLHRAADKATDLMIKLLERDDNNFNTLIHADLSINNIMFRYSDNTDEVVDVRYVAVY